MDDKLVKIGDDNVGSTPLRSGELAGSSGKSTSDAEIAESVSAELLTTKRLSTLPRPPTVLSGMSWSSPRIQTAPSAPLTYAFAFPEASCSRVRAEMLKADRDFADQERSRVQTYAGRRALAIEWICRIVAVFAEQACNLARESATEWSPSRIERRVSEVLRLLALEAERSKFVQGDKPDLTDGHGHLRIEVQAEIARSSGWVGYQATLVDLLNQRADSDWEITPGQEQGKETPADTDGNLPKASVSTALGRNIDRLRRESGWSFQELATATEMDKKLILGHVNKGQKAFPSTLAKYACTFTKKLGRPVTIAELEG